MNLKIRYDSQLQKVDVELSDMEGWLNIDVLEESTITEREEVVQQKFNDMFNKPEYSYWHRMNRNWGMPNKLIKGGFQEEDDTDGLQYVADESYQREMECREEMQNVCDFVRYAFLKKPEWADAVISVWIKGEPIREYATRIGQDENNITQKLKRARNNLKKYFSKSSDFGLSHGFYIGG